MMTRTIGWVGAVAVLAAGGCASMRGEKSTAGGGNPVAQRADVSQKQSKEALQRAADAQDKAHKQAQKAADAQAEVQKSQQQLVQAQQKAQQEQQKAQQLQQQANQLTQEASRTSSQSQAQAQQALQQQQQQLERHQVATNGQIARTSANSVSLTLQDGTSMDFSVNPRTRVLLDGKSAQPTDLQPGEDAHVTYQLSGAQPIAVVIQAVSGTAGISTGAGQPNGSNGAQEQGQGSAQQQEQGSQEQGQGSAEQPPSSGTDTGAGSSSQPSPGESGGSSGGAEQNPSGGY